MVSKSLLLAALAVTVSTAVAQKPTAPVLNSNPGARYTVYLNFTGFNYKGTWAGGTPGNVHAYGIDSDYTTFNAEEISNIKEAWVRVAQCYMGFNVNVTTVDPAPSGMSDYSKKDWYDATQYLTHTIIGGSYDWFGAAGGVSYVGVAQQQSTSDGQRTNWVFPDNGTGPYGKYMAAAIAHEDGHHLRLDHQHDENNGNEYSSNNNAQGNGSYAPIMGVGYYTQRMTWRDGKNGVNDNDVVELLKNTNIGGILDSGNGHSMADATTLAVNPDGTVNSASAKGWIMPKASTGYSAVGEDSYTRDYFRFTSLGGSATLTAYDGTEFLNPGQADPGATMRSVLRIRDISGNVVGTAVEDASTLVHTWTGNLAAGTYFAEVASYGAYTSSYEPSSRYFNMGAYFLSGSGLAAVPEPSSILALSAGAAFLLKRRRRSAK